MWKVLIETMKHETFDTFFCFLHTYHLRLVNMVFTPRKYGVYKA